MKLPSIALLLVVSSSACIAAETVDSTNSAVTILQNMERVRSRSKPFRISGILKVEGPKPTREHRFTAEADGIKYRIRYGAGGKSVAIFDGTRLLHFDGESSAVVTSPEKGAAGCFAFTPLTLGISSYLDHSYTLADSTAYRYASDLRLLPVDPSETVETRELQLIDRFGQHINFSVVPENPFRVVRYSKTIPVAHDPPLSQGGKVFSVIVAESTFWSDDDTSWLPRSISTYTVDGADPETIYSREVVELDKPIWIESFPPETFALAGLSMPVGVPVSDIVSNRRIGYWTGDSLSATLPTAD